MKRVSVATVLRDLGELAEAERQQVAAILVLPTDNSVRVAHRNDVIAQCRPLFEAGSAYQTARKMALALDTYLGGAWKWHRRKSLLSYGAGIALETIFLHRIARLNGGKSITARHFQRILERDGIVETDISPIEMSETRTLA